MDRDFCSSDGRHALRPWIVRLASLSSILQPSCDAGSSLPRLLLARLLAPSGRVPVSWFRMRRGRTGGRLWRRRRRDCSVRTARSGVPDGGRRVWSWFGPGWMPYRSQIYAELHTEKSANLTQYLNEGLGGPCPDHTVQHAGRGDLFVQSRNTCGTTSSSQSSLVLLCFLC